MIIFNYPTQTGPLQGGETLIVTDINSNNATRLVTAQEIADLAPGDPGVNRVYFNDLVGLEPNATQAASDPLIGRGVVEITGLVAPFGGGTGKGSTELTASTVGDVLVVNAGKTGYDFVPQNAGNTTYTFSSTLNAGDIELDLTASTTPTGDTQVVLEAGTGITLSGGGGTPVVITNSGAGATYTAGDGIDISVGDEISVGLTAAGGLAFDGSGDLGTSLTATNIEGAIGSNGDILSADGADGVAWSLYTDVVPVMSDTALGIAKVEDNTTVVATAETVTTTADRTYGIQKNASDQLVVNVPWTDGSDQHGWTPLDMYHGNGNSGNGSKTIYVQSVSPTTFTASSVKVFIDHYDGSPVFWVGIYSGALTPTGTATLKGKGTISPTETGINVISLVAEVGEDLDITKGEDYVIGWAQSATNTKIIANTNGISNIEFAATLADGSGGELPSTVPHEDDFATTVLRPAMTIY